MSKVLYTTNIGEYNDKVYVDIDVRIDGGLSKEKYETLRSALQTVEDVAWEQLDSLDQQEQPSEPTK